jgi:hypothetical protein
MKRMSLAFFKNSTELWLDLKNKSRYNAFDGWAALSESFWMRMHTFFFGLAAGFTRLNDAIKSP